MNRFSFWLLSVTISYILLFKNLLLSGVEESVSGSVLHVVSLNLLYFLFVLYFDSKIIDCSNGKSHSSPT